MPAIKIIQNPPAFQLSSKWQAIPSQNEGCAVDKTGNPCGFEGLRYKILCEAKLTDREYKIRRTWGMILCIFTLGIAYCSKKVQELFKMKQIQCIYLAPESPVQRTNDIGQGQLGQPSVLTPKNVTLDMEVAPLIERIKERISELSLPPDDHRGLHIISEGPLFISFTMDEAPGLIFSIETAKGAFQHRFYKTEKAKQVISNHHLDRLCVPETCLIKIPHSDEKGEIEVLVEKALSFQSDLKIQEGLYFKHQDQLDPLVKQLCRFVYEFADGEVGFYHYPLLDLEGSETQLKCGVVNLIAGVVRADGFLEGENSPGLIGMMPNEKLMDIVIEEAKKLGLYLGERKIAGIKQRRMTAIEEYNYQQFLQKRGITGDEPIMKLELKEIEKLGLNLYEREEYIKDGVKSCTLGGAVQDVVEFINKKIYETGKREIALHTTIEPFMTYLNLGLPGVVSMTAEQEEQLWMSRIVRALKDKGYIFSFLNYTPRGYFIKC